MRTFLWSECVGSKYGQLTCVDLRVRRHDLAPLLDTASYNNTRTAYFAKGHLKHDAMNDARTYRLGWLAWMDARKSMPC